MIVLAGSAISGAESLPSWWNYSSPEATALVGIQWENLRKSPFAGAIAAELSSTGGLGFPDLDCLRQARNILISSPALLAVETGTFPSALLKEQALRQGFRSASYKGAALWISPRRGSLSVAQISENIVLIGARKTLESAIDRNLNQADIQYSPLLARASRFAHTADLWVVSTKLPDPLAGIFVPIDAEAEGFEGAVSVQGGLNLEAWIEAASEDAAAEIAENLRQSKPSLPAIAQDLIVTANDTKVALELHVTEEQLSAGLRDSHGSHAPQTVAAVSTHATPPPPPERQVIRILGLDNGPREIPFPAAQPQR